MLQQIKKKALSLLGQNITYRLGRAMYLNARGEFNNEISKNGEMLVQDYVLKAWKNRLIKTTENLVIFDVGANIGEWSKALLKIIPRYEMEEQVELFSFEPVPYTANLLRANLVSNNPHLHIEEIALSSCVGSAQIHVVEDGAGTNSLHADFSQNPLRSVDIELTTAVDFCNYKGIEHVHLLKCDTEGHDMEVIRGALSLLQQERISVLQFEYNHRWVFSRNFLYDVFILIENLPYKVAKLQPKNLLIFDGWHPELEKFFEGNYALIHNDALEWFEIKKVSFDNNNVLTAK